jgi:hypothetical protein
MAAIEKAVVFLVVRPYPANFCNRMVYRFPGKVRRIRVCGYQGAKLAGAGHGYTPRREIIRTCVSGGKEFNRFSARVSLFFSVILRLYSRWYSRAFGVRWYSRWYSRDAALHLSHHCG